ncbi:hypothetical protein [Acrocarpospora catenulata]|uniref:hypothetical protein n=1 Tax=Acrocarpospora catenulata TaxID=2836182 RepID=UPI001BDA7505|nr:hypothetical protein [Acrocarpospora catenulata]
MGSNRVWQRVAGWFSAQAEQVTVVFLPEEDSRPLVPYQGYIRLWLAEGFLADRRSWGVDWYPALHGGVTLGFLGDEAVTFSTMSKPVWMAAGIRLDEQMSPLVPYNSGVVGVQAGLYRASDRGPLGAAVQVVGALAGLMGPPLATAASIATKVSDGLDSVLEATGEQPVLGVSFSMLAPGGGGRPVQAGHLVVLNTPKSPGELTIADGLLHVDGVRPTGIDYLVLRIECRTELPNPITRELADLIARAIEAKLRGHRETFEDLRKEAIIKAWCSPDLVPPDRPRVAKFIAEQIDAAKLGIVPPLEPATAGAADHLVARDSPDIRDLTLADLL